MTVGDPVMQIIKFTIPMLLGNVAQQLYNTVDSIIVGRFVGDNALAAVGSAGPILNLMLVLFMGISVGASIMVSQFFGARQRESLSRSIGACVVLTGAASLIIMIVGPIVTMPLLRLLGTPESIIGWCRNYLIIICLGIAGGGYYNILSGVLRGLGDSMSALIYLLVATGINIVLDYVFVAYLGLGVAGVALATVIAQFVSAFLSLRRLTQMKEYFDMKKEYLIPDSDYISQLIRLGIPSGITQAIFSMSMIVVQSLTNTFGEQFIAANVIVMRIDGFVVLPALSFGAAMTTYAGQNIGAGRMDRVVEGARKGIHREQYDIAAARALAPLNVLCEYLLPYVRVGGYALCWKGPSLQGELEAGRRAARLLGGRLEMPVCCPVEGREWDHRILPIRKTEKTAGQYPRKPGIPKAKPLGEQKGG